MTTAAAQRNALWAQITETAYADDALPGIPPDDGSGVATLGLLLPPFLWQTFKHLGDTMPFMHKKTIHKHGTVAKVAFKVASKKYTGIFASGGIGLVRLSLAAQAGNFKPGMALKVLIDGGQPSHNFVAMNSREGQTSRNYFDKAFSNILPPPTTAATIALTGSFAIAITTLSFKAADRPLSASIMPLLEPAQVTADGTPVPDDKVTEPYQIVFEPRAELTKQYAAVMEQDMRLALATLPAGTVLYDILLRADGNEAGESVGTLVTESEFVPSKFGDDALFFRHPSHRRV